MNLRAAACWRLARPLGAHAVRSFEDGRALYDRESGRTALLSPLAAFILDRLALHVRHGLDENGLLRDLMAQDESLPFSVPEFTAARHQIADALRHLAAAGLVARQRSGH